VRLRGTDDEESRWLVRRSGERLCDGAGAVGDVEPREDVLQVLADRVFGHHDFLGDLGVAVTGRDETKQFPLPRRKIGHQPTTAFELLVELVEMGPEQRQQQSSRSSKAAPGPRNKISLLERDECGMAGVAGRA
jgi:hypothetical protein